MSPEELLAQMEEKQTNRNTFERQEKLRKQRERDERIEKWDMIDDTIKTMKNDFKMFDEVTIDAYYASAYRGVWNVYKGFKFQVKKLEDSGYGCRQRFESQEGNFCQNMVLGDRDGFTLQLQVRPDKTMVFCLTSKYFKFEQAEQYLGLPEGRGWTNNPLETYHRTFHKYEGFKSYLHDFLMATVNTESFKKKHELDPEEKKVVQLRNNG